MLLFEAQPVDKIRLGDYEVPDYRAVQFVLILVAISPQRAVFHLPAPLQVYFFFVFAVPY